MKIVPLHGRVYIRVEDRHSPFAEVLIEGEVPYDQPVEAVVAGLKIKVFPKPPPVSAVTPEQGEAARRGCCDPPAATQG